MLTGFDVGFGILVLVSAILATARGLTREVLSLATWAGSAAIAVFMWQYHPEIAQGFISDPTVAAIATVVVTFIVALIVLHIITMRIADFVVDSRIGPLDRTLGFVFGVLRGVLIAIVVVIFGQWLVPGKLPDWAAQSKSLPMLTNMGNSLMAALPANLDDQVTSLIKRGTQSLDSGTEGEAPSTEAAPPDAGTDSGGDEDGTEAPPQAPAQPDATSPSPAPSAPAPAQANT